MDHWFDHLVRALALGTMSRREALWQALKTAFVAASSTLIGKILATDAAAQTGDLAENPSADTGPCSLALQGRDVILQYSTNLAELALNDTARILPEGITVRNLTVLRSGRLLFQINIIRL